MAQPWCRCVVLIPKVDCTGLRKLELQRKNFSVAFWMPRPLQCSVPSVPLPTVPLGVGWGGRAPATHFHTPGRKAVRLHVGTSLADGKTLSFLYE